MLVVARLECYSKSNQTDWKYSSQIDRLSLIKSWISFGRNVPGSVAAALYVNCDNHKRINKTETTLIFFPWSIHPFIHPSIHFSIQYPSTIKKNERKSWNISSLIAQKPGQKAFRSTWGLESVYFLHIGICPRPVSGMLRILFQFSEQISIFGYLWP